MVPVRLVVSQDLVPLRGHTRCDTAMHPAGLRLPRGVAFQNELVEVEVVLDPSGKLVVIDSGYFEVGGLPFSML